MIPVPLKLDTKCPFTFAFILAKLSSENTFTFGNLFHIWEPIHFCEPILLV